MKPVCGPCNRGGRECVYGALPSGDDLSPKASDKRIDPSSNATSGAQHMPGRPDPPQPTSRPVSDQQPHNGHASRPEQRTVSQPWPQTPVTDENLQTTSPRSTFSTSTGYGTEVAPLRWFGLLAGDAQNGSLDLPALESLSDAALASRYHLHPDGLTATEPASAPRTPLAFGADMPLQNPSKLLQISALSPAPPNGQAGNVDERQYWQSSDPVRLTGHEYDMFHRFVTDVSQWIDMFDPLKHFSTFVPHLAIYNEGLMKAILALGARHLSIKPLHSGEANIDRTSAVQYYYETLQYLQSAMRFTTYKNSLELLATVLVVSTYEMIDGAGKGWERHLKGVFWIQRSRDINGESGGLEQAIWWAWLRQDVWAAFKERRRCFSFFKPTKPYQAMNIWDMASKIVYILAQSVNYSSDEEKQLGEADLPNRIVRANSLLNMLDEWRSSISIHFDPLPINDPGRGPFQALWISPSAFGASLQMYCMARILLLINKPAAGGYLEYMSRDKIISESIDMIGGIAMKLTDNASRLMSSQCLFAAGLYCNDPAKRECIAELISDHSAHTGWPSNGDLAEELRAEWSKQQPK